MTTRATIVPALPSPTADNSLAFQKAIKSLIDVREGLTGDPLDANVTFRDLVNVGAVTLNPGGGKGGSIVIPPWVENDGYDPTADLTTPQKPENVSISSGIATIMLEWDQPTYRNHAYAEIFRSETNVIGNAVKIGSSDNRFYVDAVGMTSKTYYYWVRFVSQANVIGPFHSTAGLVQSTGMVGGVDLSPLIITADKIASGAIDLGGAKVTGLLQNANMEVISDPTKIADSLIGNTKLANLAVDAAKLADSSVTATKIANLAVGTAAIQNGAITNALIANAAVGSAQIANAAITSAKIGELAVGNAAIQNGAITNAKIGDLAVDNAKIASLDAAKITTGFLDANRIQAGTIDASKIDTRNLTIKDAAGNIIFSASGTSYANVSGLGSLATQNSVNANQVSGLGSLATQNAVSASQVSGLGSFATLSKINTGNVSTYIEAGAITNAYIGNFISSYNFNGSIDAAGNFSSYGTTGWAIGKGGVGVFNNIYARGDIQATSLNAATGTFSGSLSGATGTFSGSLNAATGTFSGSLNAATGTFSGSLTAAVVNTDNIVGNALSVTYVGNTTGNVVNCVVTVPSGASSVVVMVSPGAGIYQYGGESGAYLPVYCDLYIDGSAFIQNANSAIIYGFPNPAPGVFTATAYRGQYSGVMTMVVMVNKR